MPKMKSNRGAAKRFRATKNGGFKRNKAYNRHLKTCKSAKRRRHLRQATMVAPAEEARVSRMLPYS
jgi:large subunit ribosomal protein L35